MQRPTGRYIKDVPQREADYRGRMFLCFRLRYWIQRFKKDNR